MDTDAIKTAFHEVLDEEREKYWVDSETHHEHHRVIGGWIWAVNIMKKGFLLSFIGGFVTGLGILIWVGFKSLAVIKGAIVG